MTDSNVIHFPLMPRIAAEQGHQSAEGIDDMLRCWCSWEHLLDDLTKPYQAGWVSSEWQCLRRRTQAEFAALFEVTGGGLGYGFTGFRDVAEASLCQQAALAAGSRWRLIDYYRQDRQWGGDGLGILPLALATYQRCSESGLFEGRLLVPPSGE